MSSCLAGLVDRGFRIVRYPIAFALATTTIFAASKYSKSVRCWPLPWFNIVGFWGWFCRLSPIHLLTSVVHRLAESQIAMCDTRPDRTSIEYATS